eukprot:ANDGO_00265.mRNA.1 hypothetical protein
MSMKKALTIVLAAAVLCLLPSASADAATASSVVGTWTGNCYQYAATTSTGGSAPYQCITPNPVVQSYSVTYNATHVTYSNPAGTVVNGGTTYYVAAYTTTNQYTISNGQITMTDLSGASAGCYYLDITGGDGLEKGIYVLATGSPATTGCATSALDPTLCISGGNYNYKCTTTKSGYVAPSSAAAFSSSVFVAALLVAIFAAIFAQ